jgi:hypothetical protein
VVDVTGTGTFRTQSTMYAAKEKSDACWLICFPRARCARVGGILESERRMLRLWRNKDKSTIEE